jgi:predicted DCC family thiol-disulfide oxidoreductase YuxK
VTDLPPRIVLYDGVCGLCHRTVNLLLRIDRKRAFRFAPLQGETAERLKATHPEIPRDLDSVVYVEDGRVYLRSRAFFHAAKHLGWPWRMAYWLRWIPAPLADLLYHVVARMRYRVFGRYDTCRMPTTADRQLLLP